MLYHIHKLQVARVRAHTYTGNLTNLATSEYSSCVSQYDIIRRCGFEAFVTRKGALFKLSRLEQNRSAFCQCKYACLETKAGKVREGKPEAVMKSLRFLSVSRIIIISIIVLSS